MTIYGDDDEQIWEAEAPDYDDEADRLKYSLEWCPSDGRYWITVQYIIYGKIGSTQYYPISHQDAARLGRMLTWHDEDLSRRNEVKEIERHERGIAEQALMASIVKGYVCKRKEEYEDE